MNREYRIQQMQAMRCNGRTLQEIADAHGISRERVRQLIGNTGQVAFEARRRLYEQNKHLSNSELAALLGVKVTTVYQYRSRST